MVKDMQTVVMAGGQGTRLRPLTSTHPKPMVPVANKPLMEHIINLLDSHGLADIVVTLQFLPTVITSYFGDGRDWGVDISYSTEESPLGTAGSVKNAKKYIERTFMVVSGDALTDIDLSAVARYHREKGAAVTIVLKQVPNPLEFGLVVTDADGRIVKFLEKPGWGEVFSDTINTGIYVIEHDILDYIPGDGTYDFSKELFPRLLDEGLPIYGYIAEGYWCDVGNLEQYLSAHKDILDGLVGIDVPGHRLEQGIWVGDGVDIDDSVDISGPALIGNHVRIEPNSKVREYTVLGNNIVVKRDNFLHRSVIMDNTYIGPTCHIRGAIICRNCDIKSGVRIDEGGVLGDECLIGDNALINNGVTIYPFKTVDSRATVNTSIIWQSKGMRSLFGKRGVSGLINVDITPEKAVLLGMAYGSSLQAGAQVVTSRGGTRAARIIKRALMAGLNATGVHIRDLEMSAIPVNRFTVDSHGDQGGVDVRTSDKDTQWIDINFFDEEGRDLGQGDRRKIEAKFSRNDFRRAFSNELGEIYYPARAREAYAQALAEHLRLEAIQKRGFKLVLDFNFGTSSLILPSILGYFKCETMSLNPYTSETRLTTTKPTRRDSLIRLGDVVTSFRADLGILFDSGAERLAIVDDCGKIIAGSDLLVVMTDLVTSQESEGKIAVPVNQPSVIDNIARKRGFGVVKTRLDRSSIMAAGREEGTIFAGAGDGGFIFPRFMPVYDALITFGKLIEMLSSRNEQLSAIMAGLPSYHIVHREVVTSWENKGTIMRELLEKYRGDGVDSTDGIKISCEGDDSRWILVLPDQDEPVLHLYAEGEDSQDCREILDRYEKEIKASIS